MRDADWEVVERTLDHAMQYCAQQAAAGDDDARRKMWQDEADAVTAARVGLARLRVALFGLELSPIEEETAVRSTPNGGVESRREPS